MKTFLFISVILFLISSFLKAKSPEEMIKESIAAYPQMSMSLFYNE